MSIEKEEVTDQWAPHSVTVEGKALITQYPPSLQANAGPPVAYLLPSPQQHQQARSAFFEAPPVFDAPSAVHFLALAP